MEVEEQVVFVAHEVDIDYEFDAARFFNFSREETPVEARRVELWFESAKSYPPSRKPLLLSLSLCSDETTPFWKLFEFQRLSLTELSYSVLSILFIPIILKP